VSSPPSSASSARVFLLVEVAVLRAVVVLVVLALAAAVTILVGFDAAALLSPTFAALARVIRFGGDICGSMMASVCCTRIDVEMLESVVR
jgi:hypothetical protein